MVKALLIMNFIAFCAVLECNSKTQYKGVEYYQDIWNTNMKLTENYTRPTYNQLFEGIDQEYCTGKDLYSKWN